MGKKCSDPALKQFFKLSPEYGSHDTINATIKATDSTVTLRFVLSLSSWFATDGLPGIFTLPQFDQNCWIKNQDYHDWQSSENCKVRHMVEDKWFTCEDWQAN